MHELRWNPVLREWVIVASHRQERPVDVEGEFSECPFCAGSEEVFGDKEILALPNRYPSLVLDASPASSSGDIFKAKPGFGSCEVILETLDHSADLADLPVAKIALVLSVFAQRYTRYSQVKGIKYVLEFRNKGREIGVTLHHPHSQLYAMPFIPPIIRRELSSSRTFWKRTGGCLFCRIIDEEMRSGVRLLTKNQHAMSFLPYYAKWPYELHLFPRAHATSLADLNRQQLLGFSRTLKEVLLTYNRLFDFSMPYVMAVHQAPVEAKSYPYFHMHVEFYPPYRTRDKLKYPGGVERGAGTFTYDGVPEEKAEELKKAYRRDST